MLYFKKQEEAGKLFTAIKMSAEASGKDVILLDTLSETATQNLMTDLAILLGNHKIQTAYHKIKVVTERSNKVEFELVFTNPNTLADTVLDVEDIQIIEVTKLINMSDEDIVQLYLPIIEEDE